MCFSFSCLAPKEGLVKERVILTSVSLETRRFILRFIVCGSSSGEVFSTVKLRLPAMTKAPGTLSASPDFSAIN